MSDFSVDFDRLNSCLDSEDEAWRRVHPETVTPAEFGELQVLAGESRRNQKELNRNVADYVKQLEARDRSRQTAALVAVPVMILLMWCLGLWCGFLIFGVG